MSGDPSLTLSASREGTAFGLTTKKSQAQGLY
jgi:hypothetical protein